MSEPNTTYCKEATLVKVIDGDTLRLRIDLGWAITTQQDIRLRGVDTPEPRGAEKNCGKYVTAAVEQWIDERTDANRVVKVDSRKYTTGKYGRTIADVWVGGESLNQFLLTSKLAWMTSDDGALEQPRDLRLLNLPPSLLSDAEANQQ